MVVEKLYPTNITDTNIPITGTTSLDGEEFTYEIYLLPIIGRGKAKTKKKLIERLGRRIMNGKLCLNINEKTVEENITNDEYSAIVFVKNTRHDDSASGTIQYYNWCEGEDPDKIQIWINDLCRIYTEKQSTSPLKILLKLFESITVKYANRVNYTHLMVDKANTEEAETLVNIYKRYGFVVVDDDDCKVEGDEYIIMKKEIDRENIISINDIGQISHDRLLGKRSLTENKEDILKIPRLGGSSQNKKTRKQKRKLSKRNKTKKV